MKFWIFAVTNLVLSVADIVLTYIGTPDLALEANPLVTVFGLGWSALIIANVFTYALYIVLIYMVFVRYQRSVMLCEGFKQFISMLCYDRPDKFVWIWWKFPKNIVSSTFAPAGYAFAYVFPVIRLLAIFSWILYFSGVEFCVWCFLNVRHISFIHIEVISLFVLGIILGIILVFRWYYKEYRINKTALEALENL